MKKIIKGLFAVILCVGLVGCGQQSEEQKAATEKYDVQVKRIQKQEKELKNEIKESRKIIKKAEKNIDEKVLPNLEDQVSVSKAAIKSIPEEPDEVKEINKVTKKLKNIDYTKKIESLKKAKNDVLDSQKKYKLVDNPKDSYVIESLKSVEGIQDVSAVTEDNDPNGNLNKDGGYTTQVYFSYSLVDQNDVSGDTVIDKGTDCGGSIEVYKTEKEAKKREDYLAGYDGGLLASGSHKVIGTTLVRTSDKLTATQQKDLEAKIIEQLTKLK